MQRVSGQCRALCSPDGDFMKVFYCNKNEEKEEIECKGKSYTCSVEDFVFFCIATGSMELVKMTGRVGAEAHDLEKAKAEAKAILDKTNPSGSEIGRFLRDLILSKDQEVDVESVDDALIKEIAKVGTGAGIYVPRKWMGKTAVVRKMDKEKRE